ncbi:transferase activity protein, partial [Linderina macrospora]
MSSTNSYVLRYFPTHGVTETIRLLLDFVGAKWVEEHPEWPAKKAEQPFGHLPVLVEKNADGQVAFILSESLVIERYILRKHGLMPADPELAARQEQLRDQLYDTHVAMGYAHHSDGEFKKLA